MRRRLERLARLEVALGRIEAGLTGEVEPVRVQLTEQVRPVEADANKVHLGHDQETVHWKEVQNGIQARVRIQAVVRRERGNKLLKLVVQVKDLLVPQVTADELEVVNDVSNNLRQLVPQDNERHMRRLRERMRS